MIIDLIEVLNKEEDPDPDPKEIILDPDPDLRGPKCNGSFGSGSGTLAIGTGSSVGSTILSHAPWARIQSRKFKLKIRV
jgi:hypothetical protein